MVNDFRILVRLQRYLALKVSRPGNLLQGPATGDSIACQSRDVLIDIKLDCQLPLRSSEQLLVGRGDDGSS
jgi:hypothetical protein